MSRTRIKICGITRLCDAQAVVAAGADAVGLVFYGGSQRFVEVQRAAEIARAVPPFVSLVGLFVDAEESEVRDLCKRVPLDLLQFHGSESRSFCQGFGKPWMKALRVSADMDVASEMEAWPDAGAILLDTYRKGQPGGTGESFDWDLVPSSPLRPVVLAGGLRPDNVTAAIERVRPYAVDVSGGVESAPGIKDPDKIEAFISAVRAADMEQ